jgi:hypothetical protein
MRGSQNAFLVLFICATGTSVSFPQVQAVAQPAPASLQRAIAGEEARRFIRCPDGMRYRNFIWSQMGTAQRVTHNVVRAGGLSDADRLNGVTGRSTVRWYANAERTSLGDGSWGSWRSITTPLGTVIFEQRNGTWRAVRQDWRIGPLHPQGYRPLTSCTEVWTARRPTPPPQPQGPRMIDLNMLHGLWTRREGDCSNGVEFHQDGTFRVRGTSIRGGWRVENGNELLMGDGRTWTRDVIDHRSPGVMRSITYGHTFYRCG